MKFFALTALAALAITLTGFVQSDAHTDPDVLGLTASEARAVLGSPALTTTFRGTEEWFYDLAPGSQLELRVHGSVVVAQTLTSTHQTEQDAVHRIATITADLALDGIEMQKSDLRSAYAASGNNGRRHAVTGLSSRANAEGERQYTVLFVLVDSSGQDAD